MAKTFVDADPYPWPFDGELRPDNTALIVIVRYLPAKHVELLAED